MRLLSLFSPEREALEAAAGGAAVSMRFTIGTEDLEAAVADLRLRLPLVLYPDAWHALIGELGRRKVRSSPQPIELTRAVFDQLPDRVRELLTKHATGASGGFGR